MSYLAVHYLLVMRESPCHVIAKEAEHLVVFPLSCLELSRLVRFRFWVLSFQF